MKTLSGSKFGGLRYQIDIISNIISETRLIFKIKVIRNRKIPSIQLIGLRWVLFPMTCFLLGSVTGAGKHRQAWIFLEVGVRIGEKAQIETTLIGVVDYLDVLAGLTQSYFYSVFGFHAVQLEGCSFFLPKTLDNTSTSSSRWICRKNSESRFCFGFVGSKMKS